ncbi:hypothetical protein [Gymnodinialimonas ceratoperidinii]|uniref:Uncharacterized protein n=1 Tax=Gymnodinialimonas ceratoperidinii TaxID=2856823 RepID=A0A8F6TVS5_9RHOB|nr:hypothetical protein [Gymnodinialimonas ceratoperidinii]QXT39373.1 hypothetical protein KYE46_15820 [Gymnodinialimonas ceratoperidinii]
MLRATALALPLSALALLPAHAQSSFERLEAVATTINGMMFDAMVEQTPALEGNMPSAEWSEGLRAAYTCMYDGFVAQAGEPAVSEMVTEMENRLETLTTEEVMNGDVEVGNPGDMTDDEVGAIVAECGMMDAFMAHLAQSGALQIMMQADQ